MCQLMKRSMQLGVEEIAHMFAVTILDIGKVTSASHEVRVGFVCVAYSLSRQDPLVPMFLSFQ